MFFLCSQSNIPSNELHCFFLGRPQSFVNPQEGFKQEKNLPIEGRLSAGNMNGKCYQPILQNLGYCNCHYSHT